jgi:hypothetical protein
MDVDIISLGIVQEVLSSRTFHERDTGHPLAGAEENVQQSTTREHIDDVLVGCTIQETFEHQSPTLLL